MNNTKLTDITSSNTESHLLNDPYSNKINKEDFTLIWLDKTLDKDINDSRQTSKLRQAVDDLKTYVDLNECENYIRSHENENIIFVVSGTYGQHIVPNIHDLTQIKRIYVFCRNEASHIEWIKKYIKVNNNIFTQTEKLLEALKPYIRQYQQTLLIQKSIVDVQNKTADFKWARLLIDTLIRLPPESKAKAEMNETLRKYYHDNPATLQFIDTFERNEQNESAIKWYTKETCLYQIVNRIFREEQIDEIYNYRAFIKDLAEQLNQLYIDQITLYREYGTSGVIVYRGAGVGNHDIEVLKSNTGQLISFNGFLSTSPDEKLALNFAHGQFGSIDLTPVLFAYKIDIDIDTTAFAFIPKEMRAIENESEVLFNPGAIFKIEQVEYKDEDKMWRVTFSLCEKDFMHPHIATSYNNIGLVYKDKGDYDNALDYCKQALDIWKQTLPEEHPDIASSYNNIGLIYQDKGDYDNALDCYKKAHDIWKQTLPEKHPHIAITYNNIGLVYKDKGDYDNALDYCKPALGIRKQTLPENHSDIATSYNNIGLIYQNKGDYDNALDYYKKALDIWKQTLPENHPDIATDYNNIGVVYQNKGDYDIALDYYKKALDIGKQTLPENHPDIARSYNSIGEIYQNKGDYDNAFDYLQKALDIWKQTLPEKHPDIARSYNNIGGVYQNKGDYDNALDYYKKALDIEKQTVPENHLDIATGYNNIGVVYQNKGDYDNALDYLQKALDIWKQTLPEKHPDIARSYNNIG
ncbi:unnamed protein product, partial [Rotaria sp. Silwood1]